MRRDRCPESGSCLTGIALSFGRLRQRCSVRLFDIEDVGGAKSCDDPRLFFVSLVATTPQNRRQNRDALLAFPYEASDAPPGVIASDTRRGGTLRDDKTDVIQAVAMEPRHRFQRRETVGVSLLEQLRELLRKTGGPRCGKAISMAS
ncbi:MAG TPA: hypothetical protein VGQ52_07705 [Gemmatimonadaceae bacterium]|nr:hypothetical protein [Gemmatimonadaceae bacterium]